MLPNFCLRKSFAHAQLSFGKPFAGANDFANAKCFSHAQLSFGKPFANAKCCLTFAYAKVSLTLSFPSESHLLAQMILLTQNVSLTLSFPSESHLLTQNVA